MCWKRVPDGQCSNWKAPLAELISGVRNQHVAAFCRTEVCPTRDVRSRRADVLEVLTYLLTMCLSGKEKLNAMLADVVGEISIKQKLIDELEASQKRLRAMRAHYEEKLCTLANKIRETELERDKVLANLGQLCITTSTRFIRCIHDSVT